MDNELKRYYRKIRIILEIDPKTIHEELWDPVFHYIQQLQDGQNVFVKEEKMSMIILHLLVHSPNLQVKISYWFDKLSAMIHIQLLMKLYLSLLFLSWYNRTNYPWLSQDEKKLHLVEYPSTNL